MTVRLFCSVLSFSPYKFAGISVKQIERIKEIFADHTCTKYLRLPDTNKSILRELHL